jgi:integrase
LALLPSRIIREWNELPTGSGGHARMLAVQTQEIWKKGSVPRKPLKTRKSIDPKWYRYIPIFDKDTWNTLVKRWNERIEELENQSVEIDPRDGLLFEGITSSMFYADCVKAFTKLGLKFRSPHKLRHTFLTWFYDKTNEDLLLAKKVGGHEDLRSMENYSHLTEQIGLERTRFAQKKSKMKMAT